MTNNSNNDFTPFLVADRQASLRIISGIDISKVSGKIGIMSHANTTANFKATFNRFPCLEKKCCEVIHQPCPYNMDLNLCQQGMIFTKRIVKISDSGVFTKEGCMFKDYEKLFCEYEKMNLDYGIIIDYMREIDKTLKSAKEGINTFNNTKRNFKLIGVAQGNSTEEYLECYQKLQSMGYNYIAIGGLLKRVKNTVRFTKVENEQYMLDVIKRIREFDSNGWLFALGCFSRERRLHFINMGIFGSDYKGWIFHYSKRYNKRHMAQKDRFFQIRKFLENNLFGSSRLLIISCSQRKITTNIIKPAIYIYDGPFFKILRKQISSFDNNNGFDIYILSAKYGLINPLKKILAYEHKMSHERAIELNKSTIHKLHGIVKKKTYSDVFINLGEDYLQAIDGFIERINNISPDTKIHYAKGRIGERMKQMNEWIKRVE